jgi:hypothetical protein
MRVRHRRLCRIAAASILIGGCVPRVEPGIPAPVVEPTDPARVYAAARRREDSVHTLRARFAATVTRPHDVRRADGVLVVKKPARFRVRLLSAFGFTVFDYVSWGAHARMELPLEGRRVEDDEIANHSAFSPSDMRAVFLREAGTAGLTCVPATASGTDTVVTCRDGQGQTRRRLLIDSATATVREETQLAGDHVDVTMRFGDYRVVDATLLPYHIDLLYPERAVRLAITVRSYEVNPELADDLFAWRLFPESPSGCPSIRRQEIAATRGERVDEYSGHTSPLTLRTEPSTSCRPAILNGAPRPRVLSARERAGVRVHGEWRAQYARAASATRTLTLPSPALSRCTGEGRRRCSLTALGCGRQGALSRHHLLRCRIEGCPLGDFPMRSRAGADR